MRFLNRIFMVILYKFAKCGVVRKFKKTLLKIYKILPKKLLNNDFLIIIPLLSTFYWEIVIASR